MYMYMLHIYNIFIYIHIYIYMLGSKDGIWFLVIHPLMGI